MAKVDWTKSCDRRSVAASLVESVYLLQYNRQGKEAQAPPLWKAFNFELYKELTDDADSSIFGAIFQLCSTSTSTSTTAPRYVVAFRGTIPKGHASKRDHQLNCKLMRNKLHQTTRFQKAIQAVRHVVQTFGSENVWLAGHSQGAAIALLVGKDMAAPWELVEVEQEGVEKNQKVILLDAFVFNPPFVSIPIERMINSRGRKFALRAAGTVIKAGLALTMEDRGRFAALAPWRPHLFLNPKDPVCAEYIGYFQHNLRMKEMGAGKMARLAAQHSVVGAVLNALGKKWREPLHRIPSAQVTVNCNSSGWCVKAHSIRQWCRPDLETKTYTYTLIDP